MTMQKVHGVLSNLDNRKRDEGRESKGKHKDKHEAKIKNIDINKLSFTQQKEIRCWVCGNPNHKKPDCRLIKNFPRKISRHPRINQKKKKINVQNETSDNEASGSKDSSKESIAEDVIVSYSGARAIGWSGVHLRPTGNV